MQYGSVSPFGFITLTDDDKISIPDLSNKLDKLMTYLQNWDRYDKDTQTSIHNSVISFSSAAGHYFNQQGSAYWYDYSNRDELFKFLTIYADAIYFVAVCYAKEGSRLALTVIKDAYAIFPPEHRQRREFESRVKGFIAANRVNLFQPVDIEDSVGYLLKNIYKYLN